MTSNELPNAVDELLGYELRWFTAHIGLEEPPGPLAQGVAVRALNHAERLSRRGDPEASRLCLLICALVWEHRHGDWKAVPAFLTELLIRIGLGPTAKMVQAHGDKAGRFAAVGSVRSEIELAGRLLANEVELPGGRLIDLTSFQASVWAAIGSQERLGISAPTSAGKSFVLSYRIGARLARDRGEIVYVVPTLSLVNQVTRDLRSVLLELEVEDALVTQTYSPKYRDAATSVVYVLTQERAQAALAQGPDVFRDLLLFVVDEVQNVERVSSEDHDRSRILYDVITAVLDDRNPRQVIISGPRIDDMESFSQELFGRDSAGITDELPPVANVTYSFGRRRGGTTITQHADLGRASRTLNLNGRTLQLKKTFGKKQWNEGMFDFLGHILPPLRRDGGVLLFSPTGNQATKTALEIARRLGNAPDPDQLRSLADYASETVHPRYGLTGCLTSGVGYHHGKMPHHLRASVEHAFADGAIDVMACTTTLMQGVNLPAKTLIARNPNLFTKARSGVEPAVLSGYEFGNLRGRAGRLMEDFVGRTIVLDEAEFERQELPLFEFPAKSLNHGYKTRFERKRGAVLEDLRRRAPVSREKTYNDLLMYVRQSVLRYGSGAAARMARTGVTIEGPDLDLVQRQLDALSAPREFVLKFPYWDPFDLDRLWLAFQNSDVPSIPSSPFASRFNDAVRRVMAVIEAVVPYYRTRYLGSLPGNTLWSVIESAQSWARGVAIKRLVDWNDADTLDDPLEIDRRVYRVQNTAGFALPRLLSPVVMAQGGDNPVLTFLEMGAYEPIARRLVELGIPRETAVRASSLLDREFVVAEGRVVDRHLRTNLRRISEQLWQWERLQLRDLTAAEVASP